MIQCPVCDPFEAKDVQTVASRLKQRPLLLITLACDFAERACDQAPNPAQAREWLRAARDWKSDQEIPEANAVAAWEIYLGTGDVETAARAAANAVAEAVGAANAAAAAERCSRLGATQAESEALIWATNAVVSAAEATASIAASLEDERTWQIEHMRALTCICAAAEIGLPGSRSRKSLLAY